MKVFDLVKGFCFLGNCWNLGLIKLWMILWGSTPSKVCDFVDSLSFCLFYLFFFFLEAIEFPNWFAMDFFFLYCQSKHPTDLRFHDSWPLTYLLLNVKFLRQKLNWLKINAWIKCNSWLKVTLLQLVSNMWFTWLLLLQL